MSDRRWLVALAGLNVVLLGALVARSPRASASAAPDAMSARSIELVDERGQVRAQLTVEAAGEAVFRLRDAKGQVRVKVGASEDGSGLLLMDQATEPAIHLLAKKDGPTLTLTGRDGRRRSLAPSP
jgi:hypothetical protein